jgi:glycosyltransferase involved in cell wall biosynthesis
MGSRPRILVLSPTAPEVVTNGIAPRVRRFVAHLARSADVTLVHWASQPEESLPVESLGTVRRISCVPPSTGTPGNSHSWHHRFRLGWPYPVQSGIQDAVAGLSPEQEFDACLVFHPTLLRPAVETVRLPIVVDAIDEPVLATWREFRASRGLASRLKKARLIMQHIRYLRTYCPRAHACCVVSEHEARSLRRLVPAARVEVVPSGVDCNEFRPSAAVEEPRSMLFVGNLSFPPNQAAVSFFARKVLPILERSVPGFRLYIVGPSPSREVIALSSDPRIVITGFVEDVRPYFGRCSVFVSPLVSGGGLKTKVLEAWAMARPVVATPLGSVGLLARSEVNLVVADRPESFARVLAELFADPERARRIGLAGRETVLKHYRWDHHAARIQALLLEAAAIGSRSD